MEGAKLRHRLLSPIDQRGRMLKPQPRAWCQILVWRFPAKRYAVFVILISLVAGGLRFWADVDRATLIDRYPHIGHGILWYRPLGTTLGFIVNMPAAILCAAAIPSGLPRYSMKDSTWTEWALETGVAITQAALTAVFWFLLRAVILRLREFRLRFSRTMFFVNTSLALCFAIGTAFALSNGIAGFAKFFAIWNRSEIAAYLRASRLSEVTLIDPILYVALALWCSAASLLLLASAVRLAKSRVAVLRHD